MTEDEKRLIAIKMACNFWLRAALKAYFGEDELENTVSNPILLLVTAMQSALLKKAADATNLEVAEKTLDDLFKMIEIARGESMCDDLRRTLNDFQSWLTPVDIAEAMDE